MTDKYTQLVSRGLGRDIARKLGLPQPVELRRYQPGQPLVDGPVLVQGSGTGAEDLASTLLSWNLDVRRHAVPKEKLGAIILVLDELTGPEDLEKPVLTAATSLRDLAPNGRVVTVSRAAADTADPAAAAARQGVDGLLRSLAKELRAGATGNGIILGDGAGTTSPSSLGALRFFLSGRSAFVDGQFLTVGSGAGQLPADAEKPLAGKVAVVTGAARGIGAAIARTLHRDGATLVVVDIPAAGDHLAGVANEVRGTALQLDISREDAGQRIIEHAVQRHGRLDIVIHNAGITRDKLLANMDQGRWNSVIAVNIAAQLRINKALLASEHFRDSPRIVSVASTSGIAGNRGQTNYAASKGGVMGMVRSTAPLLAAHGGSINAVAPGFIETEMTARIPFATREVARRLNSLQQGGRPGDVAEAIAFLASDAAGGISGEVLRVCGQNLVGGMTGSHPLILGEMPSLSKLYVNAAATAARRRVLGTHAGTALPDGSHEVRGVRAGVGNLTAYQHLVGETASDTLPAGFIHALAFPLAMSVMNRDDFPLPLLGMIHLGNRVVQSAPVLFTEAVDIRAWAENLRGHRAGTQLDLVAEVRGAGDDAIRWRGVSTYLAKGVFLPGIDKSSAPSAPAQFSTPDPTAVWQLGVDTGRAYAAVSGDFNPIHLSVLSAKALGLRRSIAHGMYLASRALADVGAAKGEAFRWDVTFEAPVFLPARVALDITTDQDHGGWRRSDYVAWNARSGRKHFSGSVAAL